MYPLDTFNNKVENSNHECNSTVYEDSDEEYTLNFSNSFKNQELAFNKSQDYHFGLLNESEITGLEIVPYGMTDRRKKNAYHNENHDLTSNQIYDESFNEFIISAEEKENLIFQENQSENLTDIESDDELTLEDCKKMFKKTFPELFKKKKTKKSPQKVLILF